MTYPLLFQLDNLVVFIFPYLEATLIRTFGLQLTYLNVSGDGK